MRLLPLTLLCCSVALTGCNYRFHIQKKAERAPPEEAEKVKFPDSLEGSTSLDGPAVKALEVAMDEFLPPGAKAQSYDEKLARCLSLRETYDVSVLRASADLYFVSFSANLSRCGLDEAVFDAGAVYAIDAQGRILARQ
ncbi:hypothetical protein [Archangium sp.]|uniref:hypothetical protein n=1 Tax=Archangium sp. TaxID=1872627 RepID=UPI002D6B8018|nr:hypothetical protein [Archangium sp.]HYO57340.1 hypothetical protein [Archangium sp.]